MSKTLFAQAEEILNRFKKDIEKARPEHTPTPEAFHLDHELRETVTYNPDNGLPSIQEVGEHLWAGKTVIFGKDKRGVKLWLDSEYRLKNATRTKAFEPLRNFYGKSFGEDLNRELFTIFGLTGEMLTLTPTREEVVESGLNPEDSPTIILPHTDDCDINAYRNRLRRGGVIRISLDFYSDHKTFEVVFTGTGRKEAITLYSAELHFSSTSTGVQVKGQVAYTWEDSIQDLADTPWIAMPLIRHFAPHLKNPVILNKKEELVEIMRDMNWVLKGKEVEAFPLKEQKVQAILEDIQAYKANPDTNPSFEPVTNGFCAPEKAGFGLEIEFDVANSEEKWRVRETIARELYREGLAWDDQYHDWHWNKRYAPTPYSKWSVEHDSTVAGEVISPVLHDTPETWETIKKVLDIIKDAGGIVSTQAGQHIHMGFRSPERMIRPSTVRKYQTHLAQIFLAYEDSIFRVHANPDTGRHRDTSYSKPLSTHRAIPDNWEIINHLGELLGHETALNLGFDTRVEFRGPDASLDYNHIRANVALASALMARAVKISQSVHRDEPVVQVVGSTRSVLESLKGEASAQELDFLGDLAFARFLSDLFKPGTAGYSAVLQAGALQKWQAPSSQKNENGQSVLDKFMSGVIPHR